MFERFTKPARQTVIEAQQQARDLGHPKVGTEHVLLGLLAQTDSVGERVLRGLGVDLTSARAAVAGLTGSDAEALKAIGIDLDAVRQSVEATFGPGALERHRRERPSLFRRGLPGHLGFTQGSKKALEQSLAEALDFKHNYIGTEHVLLGVLSNEHEPATQVLRALGVQADLRAVRALVRAELGRAA